MIRNVGRQTDPWEGVGLGGKGHTFLLKFNPNLVTYEVNLSSVSFCKILKNRHLGDIFLALVFFRRVFAFFPLVLPSFIRLYSDVVSIVLMSQSRVILF